KIGIIMGFPNIVHLFNDDIYQALPGGILEAMSRLFNNQATVFVYPMLDENGNIIQLSNYPVRDEVKGLYEYLRTTGKMRDISNFNPALLGIYAEDVLNMIRNGDPEWEKSVPSYVANIIKDKKIFGYKEPEKA